MDELINLGIGIDNDNVEVDLGIGAKISHIYGNVSGTKRPPADFNIIENPQKKIKNNKVLDPRTSGSFRVHFLDVIRRCNDIVRDIMTFEKVSKERERIQKEEEERRKQDQEMQKLDVSARIQILTKRMDYTKEVFTKNMQETKRLESILNDKIKWTEHDEKSHEELEVRIQKIQCAGFSLANALTQDDKELITRKKAVLRVTKTHYKLMKRNLLLKERYINDLKYMKSLS